MYMMQGTRAVCVSFASYGRKQKSRFQKFACLGIWRQVSCDTGSYACQPTTAYLIVFLNWVLQNRTEGPCFFAVIESKGEERSYPYRLATVMAFNNVGINDGGSDASQTIMHCPTFII